MRFHNGAIGSMSGGSCHMGSGNNKHQLEVRAIGSEGQIHVDVEREIVWLYRPDGTDERLDLPENAGLYDCDGPAHTLVDLAVGKDTAIQSPGELGARTVEVLDAAYRSAASGQVAAIRTP
jgi:predicted dehydrogenase